MYLFYLLPYILQIFGSFWLNLPFGNLKYYLRWVQFCRFIQLQFMHIAQINTISDFPKMEKQEEEEHHFCQKYLVQYYIISKM